MALVIYLKIHNYCSIGGGGGRHGSPPHTTTAKLQLNYRTTITQNHIELNGSLKTTELKEPQPSRPCKKG